MPTGESLHFPYDSDGVTQSPRSLKIDSLVPHFDALCFLQPLSLEEYMKKKKEEEEALAKVHLLSLEVNFRRHMPIDLHSNLNAPLPSSMHDAEKLSKQTHEVSRVNVMMDGQTSPLLN